MYDFASFVDRSGQGSAKWNAMKTINPNVPDGIVPFSVADMELPTAPEIIDGLKQYLDKTILGYAVATPAYREAVCNWMKRRHGWDISADWIVECSGVVPALYSAVNAFSRPGEGVIVMTPVYYPFFAAIERSGRRVVASELVESGGKYTIDFGDLKAKAARPENTVLLFCSPHNPIGRVWEKEEIERLGQICIENDVQVVSDEIHFDLIMPGHTHTVYATVGEEFADTAIVCTAPSKTFNLAGMQTSNIVIKNETLRKRFVEAQGTTGFFTCGVLGFKACELAYTKCEAWLDQLLVHLDANRVLVEEYMKKHIPQIRVFPLEGTYLQWWDCRGLGMDHKELERFMTEEALLFLDEGYIFGGGGEGFERINLACPASVLRDGLDRLRDALRRVGAK